MLAGASVFKIKQFFDTLIQKIFLQTMKINNIWGDLTDISAVKEALMQASEAFFKIKLNVLLDALTIL